MDMKLELIKMLDKVPERMLPDSLKKRMDQELETMVTEAKMEVQQGNWQLVQKYEQLKAMLEDPRLPEEKKEEFRKKVEEIGKQLEAFEKKKRWRNNCLCSTRTGMYCWKGILSA